MANGSSTRLSSTAHPRASEHAAAWPGPTAGIDRDGFDPIGAFWVQRPAHAPTGIMKAKWEQRDLQRAAWQQLGFTRQQLELIRAKVLARH